MKLAAKHRGDQELTGQPRRGISVRKSVRFYMANQNAAVVLKREEP